MSVLLPQVFVEVAPKFSVLNIILFLYKSSKSVYVIPLRVIPLLSIVLKTVSSIKVFGGKGPTISHPKDARFESFFPSILITWSPADSSIFYTHQFLKFSEFGLSFSIIIFPSTISLILLSPAKPIKYSPSEAAVIHSENPTH